MRGTVGTVLLLSQEKASSVTPWQRQGGSHVWYKMAVVHEGFTESSPFVCVAVDIYSRGFFVCRCLLGRLFCPAWYTRSWCISESGLGRWYVRMLGLSVGVCPLWESYE